MQISAGRKARGGLHAGLSDASTYDHIIQMLNENAEPQFIFDVTIQNHGGYDAIDIPEDYLVPAPRMRWRRTLHCRRGPPSTSASSSERSALESFLTRLTQLDRKVAVVFFGDHQPAFREPSTT